MPGKPERSLSAMRIDSRLARRGGAVEFLRVPGFFFGAAAQLRGCAYDLGLLPQTRLEVPVVSVGNLTAGGTGKTPFVALVVRELLARGLRPGIASRGYGSKQGDPRRENDEARLLARSFPAVAGRQNPDRVRAGQELVEAGCDCVVLDDGFQHRRLARDLDLVLVDATRPWGLPPGGDGRPPVRAFLPRGLMREPASALERAHAVCVTRVDQVTEAERLALGNELHRCAPGVSLLEGCHHPSGLWRGPLGGDEQGVSQPVPLEELRDRPVDLLSAIGNPEAFTRTLEGLGAKVVQHRMFPDHHRYEKSDLEGLGEAGRWVLTTEKDAVKLPPDFSFFALAIEFRLESGQPVLEALLDALPRGPGDARRRNMHAGLAG